MSNALGLLWINKYRPSSLDEIVLPESVKEVVMSWIEEPESLPHLLFIGPPGCGKTTLANIIVKSILKHASDYMFLNGSTERGLQVVRDDIREFIRYEPVFSRIKILFIDEADNLTQEAFKALRAEMESVTTCKIMMTGNFDVFPEPLKSRCQVIYFKPLPKDLVYQKVKEIFTKENISYREEDLIKLIDMFYPDLRKIINYSQLACSSQSSNNEFDIDKVLKIMGSDDRLSQLLCDLLKENHTREEEILYNQILCYVDENQHLGSSLFLKVIKDASEKFKSIPEYVPVRLQMGKYANIIKDSPIPSLTFLELITKIRYLKKVLQLRKVSR